MGQQLCCTNRERSVFNSPQDAAKFKCTAVDLPNALELPPSLMAVGPRSVSDASCLCPRVAVGSTDEVCVFRMIEDDAEESNPPALEPDHRLHVRDGEIVTAIYFLEEGSSRTLAVALCPKAAIGMSRQRLAQVTLWECDAGGFDWDLEVPGPGGEPGGGALAKILPCEEHPIRRLAAGRQYLVAVDATGKGFCWSSKHNFSKRTEALLHAGGVAGLTVDHPHVFTVGASDLAVRIWSIADFTPVGKIDVGSANLPPLTLGAVTAAAPAPAAGAIRISRLTAVCRPVSRWAYSRGSSSKMAPHGSVFVAGVRAASAKRQDSSSGQAVVMKWQLSDDKWICQLVQAVHEDAIAVLAYGPYDNGPLITADEIGTHRIWELGIRLRFVQEAGSEGISLQARSDSEDPEEPGLLPVAMAVQPQKGIIHLLSDNRLCFWRFRKQCKPLRGFPEPG
eukprot:gnl/TRDRNA2_/TRDRNA2_149593_c1_seq1.p1 gnl/TRDRNA2_/TRDRNA2_149593_c1~~gnl/TRDRNA2_/TRDRNA2_149593_c1_seq1.p1  ORF type:complete len:466 (-),score=81.00 gnl/TRDRNA2_/TRDRNA2_149593_c1_seq1:70-1419(-)